MDSLYRRSYLAALISDGRPLLMLVGSILILCGAFALFLSATGNFLPHDIRFLGMTAQALCAVNQCRIVHFMFHDRVAFGGALIAIGTLYLWMAEFPLRNGEAWAWWLFVLSGLAGFGSFLAYLGYGYLDTWHGVATLLLLPLYASGLYGSFRGFAAGTSPRVLFTPARSLDWFSRHGLGRACLLAVATGMILGGLTIMIVGMTRVFVPQDLTFLGLTPSDLQAVNSRLVPLIAHDRAGFGGGVCTCGILVMALTWCGTPCSSLWQVLLIAGAAGFGTAIGVHPAIGYTDLFHLAPALAGLAVFVFGMILLKKPMFAPAALNPDATRIDYQIRTPAETL